MVTGYVSTTVAQVMQWFKDIDHDIDEIVNIITQARDAEQYHMPSINFYAAAQEKVEAVKELLNVVERYINENATSEEIAKIADYCDMTIESQGIRIRNMEENLIRPVIEGEQVPGEISGTVTTVDDGDTLTITDNAGNEYVIRLAGVDSPEKGTPRGKIAREFMEKMIGGKEVKCLIDPHNPLEVYGRILAVVMLGDMNVNVEMLTSCMASPNLKFGKHMYVDPDQYKAAADRCVMGWPMEAVLKLYTKPERSMVFVDGVDTKKLSGHGEINVPVGKHRITLVKVGYGSLEVELDLETKVYELTYELQKLGDNQGLVRITTTPGPAVISINGEVVGRSPVIMTLETEVPTMIEATTENVGPIGEMVTAKLGKMVEKIIDLGPTRT